MIGRLPRFISYAAFPAMLAVLAAGANAGPPYITDDPQPTDYGRYEIYAFAQGSGARDGIASAFGIDFNYGAAPDLQLTAVLPVEIDAPAHGATVSGIGNVELAAKYKVLHQEDVGWDVAVFPRVFLPSGSVHVGDKHFSLLLPLWVGRSWDEWSTFGGGGCVIAHGGDSQDYCLMGWAVTRQILPNLNIGAEIVHQGADSKGGRAWSGVGGGLIYDVSDNIHLLAYTGPGLQNTSVDDRYTWYSSILFTF